MFLKYNKQKRGWVPPKSNPEGDLSLTSPQPEVYIDSVREDDDDSEVESCSTLSANESYRTVAESIAPSASASRAVDVSLRRYRGLNTSSDLPDLPVARSKTAPDPIEIIDLDEYDQQEIETATVTSHDGTVSMRTQHSASTSAAATVPSVSAPTAPVPTAQPEVRTRPLSERLSSILSELHDLPDSMVAHVVQIAAGKLNSDQQVDLAQKLLRWNKDKIPHTEQCPCLALDNTPLLNYANQPDPPPMAIGFNNNNINWIL